MWMLFEGQNLVAYSTSRQAAPGAVTLDLPSHLAEGLYRACAAGRVTYSDRILIDGGPWTPISAEPAWSFSQAIAAINASSLPKPLKIWMRLVSEMLLEHGKLEL